MKHLNSNNHFELDIIEYPYRILHLTDLHFGFSLYYRKFDNKIKKDITKLITENNPHLIIITGDITYPFFPVTGSMNNRKQAKKLVEFMDQFKIPYAVVFGNHDSELGSFASKDELAKIYIKSKFCLFDPGQCEHGVGNYLIDLNHNNKLKFVLGMLDSNMYINNWYYNGFDYIHDDQVYWLISELNKLKDYKALLFFHIPLQEFKEAYSLMKMGDHKVEYLHGTISEKNDYFGISNTRSRLFKEAVKNGNVLGMFNGHDHLNNIAIKYHDIILSYGLSLDYMAYKGVRNSNIHRGGKLLLLNENQTVDIKILPLTNFVTEKTNGLKKFKKHLKEKAIELEIYKGNSDIK